jgi:integrase
MMWWTGVRRGELTVLDVAHVDLDAAINTVPKTKGGVPQRVPIHPELMGLLDRWLRRRGYEAGPLFPSGVPAWRRRRKRPT